MNPTDALAYLDQIAAAFLQSLPVPAREPTRQAAAQALESLRKCLPASDAPVSP